MTAGFPYYHATKRMMNGSLLTILRNGTAHVCFLWCCLSLTVVAPSTLTTNGKCPAAAQESEEESEGSFGSILKDVTFTQLRFRRMLANVAFAQGANSHREDSHRTQPLFGAGLPSRFVDRENGFGGVLRC